MSTFTEPIIIKFLITDEPKCFEIVSPFTYYLDKLDGDIRIDIPMGFLTDFASVPRPFRNIVSPFGLHGKAAIVHDYLCEYKQAWHQIEPNIWIPYPVSRKEADEIFRKAMEILEVGKARRNVMFWGVRLYSIFTFKK